MISLLELVFAKLKLFFKLLDLFLLGVVILCGFIVDVTGTGSVVDGRNIFLDMSIARVKTGNHEAIRVSSKGLAQQAGKFTVSIRNVAI